MGMDSRLLNEIMDARRTCGGVEYAEWLHRRLERRPHCAVTRYILGCHCLDRNRIAQGVRHMMIAHHGEPAFESAALLVFAGLNWVDCREAALLPVLLNTWEEFRRPEFDRNAKERRLLDAFDEQPLPRDALSTLARRLWRLPIRSLRAQIREVTASSNMGGYPLLWATI